ncbi:DUF2878 domain-containing protein [soil metagenome]
MNSIPAALAPTRTVQLLNFVLFQIAWFAAIIAAAHDCPGWGTASVIVVIAWHLAVSARPAQEAILVVLVSLLGLVIETLTNSRGYIAFASGQPIAWLPPYWLIALWGNLAIALNVTMRWLKGRAWLSAALGAIVGPLSFLSGVRLGGGTFVEMVPALIMMGIAWAVAMPIVMWLSDRFDGVAVPAPVRSS